MVLIKVLGTLASLVKVKESADIDSTIFKLHYRITSTFLFSFSILVTTTGLVGKPINCIHSETLPEDVVNTYCWIHTTFTLPKYYHRSKHKTLYPGIGVPLEDDEKIYHSYYQWVPFVLFLQGLIFYIPHWLWSAWEGNKIRSLAQSLSTPLLTREQRQEQTYLVMDYFIISLHRHNSYALQFIFCEFLNVFNSIFNMWLLNAFLGGSFLNFGPEVLRFTQMDQEDRTDPLIMVFPRVTKCSFHKFGPSGTMETHDVMCVLALNVLNEKIFIFLWFWFVVLSCLSSLALVYRVVVFSLPSIRIRILQRRFNFEHKKMAHLLSEKLNFGDSFLLYLLSKNIEVVCFRNFIDKLCKHFESLHPMHPDIERSTPHSNGNIENFHLVGDTLT